MMNAISRILPLLLAAVLAGLAISDGHRRGVDGPLSGAEAGLSDVARHPTDYLGSELHFTFQVESRPTEWNPFLTRFGTQDYAAVIVWGDEQCLWRLGDYDDPAAMLFVRRGTALEPVIGAAGRYARFAATGVVRQVLVGRPWIEITALTALTEQFTNGSVIHASRGVELMASEHYDLAAQSFERALASNLPARARTQLERLRTESLELVPKSSVPPARKKQASEPLSGASSSQQ